MRNWLDSKHSWLLENGVDIWSSREEQQRCIGLLMSFRTRLLMQILRTISIVKSGGESLSNQSGIIQLYMTFIPAPSRADPTFAP